MSRCCIVAVAVVVIDVRDEEASTSCCVFILQCRGISIAARGASVQELSGSGFGCTTGLSVFDQESTSFSFAAAVITLVLYIVISRLSNHPQILHKPATNPSAVGMIMIMLITFDGTIITTTAITDMIIVVVFPDALVDPESDQETPPHSQTVDAGLERLGLGFLLAQTLDDGFDRRCVFGRCHDALDYGRAGASAKLEASDGVGKVNPKNSCCHVGFLVWNTHGRVREVVVYAEKWKLWRGSWIDGRWQV